MGGYLRDSLAGMATRDIDVAVPGDFLRLAQVLAASMRGSYVPLGVSLGQDHRTGRVVLPRIDGTRWTIDLTGLPGSIPESIYQDLARRDFTVDAMALPLDKWESPDWQAALLDPYGGRHDLSHGVLKALGPGVFQDDPVRLMRAVRLSASMGLEIEAGTARTIAGQAHLISAVAGERVRDELLAILALDGAKVHLEMLDELGLLCCIIPELAAARGVEQPREHYWDVFGHSINAVGGVERVTTGSQEDPVASLVPWEGEMEKRFSEEVSDGHSRRTILKLGALFHDIAKPQTKMVDADGRTRFFGHHTLGAAMSEGALQRLRVGGRGTHMVRGMVENHLRPTRMTHEGDMPTSRAVYRYFRDLGDVAVDTLYLSLGDHLAARGPELEMEGWRRHTGIVAHILEVGTRQERPRGSPKLIDGHDIIGEFGLSPGPLIGTLLEGVAEARAAGELDSREAALAWVRSRLEAIPGHPPLPAQPYPLDWAG